jgi:hypothetical protein
VTNDELQQVRRLIAGFSEKFAIDPAHTEDRGIGNVADFVNIAERLVFIPEGAALRDDECSCVSDNLDSRVAETLVDMLNAVPSLLAEVDKLRKALKDACSVATTHRAEDREEIRQLARLADGIPVTGKVVRESVTRNRSKLARERAGLSIDQAVKMLDVEREQLISIEESDATFFDYADQELRIQMADIYGTNLAWLAGDIPRYDYDAVKRVKGADTLSFHDRDVVAEFIAALP